MLASDRELTAKPLKREQENLRGSGCSGAFIFIFDIGPQTCHVAEGDS